MKLKHVHIDDYKLFHDFDIDFCDEKGPLPIVVIAGVNGTGKSTLLSYIKPQKFSTLSAREKSASWPKRGKKRFKYLPPSHKIPSIGGCLPPSCILVPTT